MQVNFTFYQFLLITNQNFYYLLFFLQMARSTVDRNLYDKCVYYFAEHPDRPNVADVRVGSGGVAAQFYCAENAVSGDHRVAEQVQTLGE